MQSTTGYRQNVFEITFLFVRSPAVKLIQMKKISESMDPGIAPRT